MGAPHSGILGHGYKECTQALKKQLDSLIYLARWMVDDHATDKPFAVGSNEDPVRTEGWDPDAIKQNVIYITFRQETPGLG